MAVFITGGHGHIGSWAAYFLAKEELGFEPEYSVEEGVKKYADWIKEVMKLPAH